MVEVGGGDLLSASRVDEVVEADARHALGAHEGEDVGDCAHVVARHGHAQAHLHAARAEAADGVEGESIGAGAAAEGVVDCLGAVDGDAHVGDAEVADPVGGGVVDERAVRGEGDAQSLLLSIRGEGADVGSGEGLAAGEQKHWDLKRGEVVNHGVRLLGGQNLLLASAGGIAM